MRQLISIIVLLSVMANISCAHDTTSVLQYLVRNPKVQTAQKPAIILMHGLGSNEENLFQLAEYLPDEYLVISARAPITLQEGSHAWYHVDFSTGKPQMNFAEHEQSRAIIIQFIKQIKEKYDLDSKNIYLGGFSQGGIMSYSVALTHPDLVAGIAVMSGRLVEEIKPLAADKSALKSLKAFVSHGTKDGTLPIHYAREGVSWLQSMDIPTDYKEYQAAHTINNEMLADLVAWLKKQIQ